MFFIYFSLKRDSESERLKKRGKNRDVSLPDLFPNTCSIQVEGGQKPQAGSSNTAGPAQALVVWTSYVPF